ncbi:MAG: polysaccharide deacetylase family protein [Eubacterium sp.]
MGTQKNSKIKRTKLNRIKKGVIILSVFAAAFFVGRCAGALKEQAIPASNVINNQENWGLGFGETGSQPLGTESAEVMKKYGAYYVGDAKEKVLYLTFDCGYENGNTPAILKALKKHKVKATFFVVGHFLKENNDLVRQIVKEGHTVGNHTYNHPNIIGMSKEKFESELTQVEDLYKEITGKEMTKYYRPPQGKYNVENLQMAQAKGYKTFFWSLAYVDWNTDSQPTKEEAFDKLLSRIHPGAIVLLHNTSKTNGEILDELLSKWEDMGYGFGILGDL